MGNSLPRCPRMRRSLLQTTSFAIAEEEEAEEEGVLPARRVLGASEVRREDKGLMDVRDLRDLRGLRW